MVFSCLYAWVCDELFEDPTPHTVGGVAEDDEDLWFFEYRPKRRKGN